MVPGTPDATTIAGMCRWLAYSGSPILMEELLYKPRFSLIDQIVERASGRLLEGDPIRPTEATELWTFRRVPGGPWLLSAIQQAS